MFRKKQEEIFLNMIIKITQELVIRRNKVRSWNSEFRIQNSGDRRQETGVGTVEKAFVGREQCSLAKAQRRKGWELDWKRLIY